MPYSRTPSRTIGVPPGRRGLHGVTFSKDSCVTDGPKLIGAGVAALMLPGWLKLLPLAYGAIVLSKPFSFGDTSTPCINVSFTDMKGGA